MWPSDCCALAWLLTTVNKDSFESSEAGLFTSSRANRAEVCAVLSARTAKKDDVAHRTQTRPFACAKRNLDIAATFAFVNLIANFSYKYVPCCAVAISVAMALSDAMFGT